MENDAKDFVNSEESAARLGHGRGPSYKLTVAYDGGAYAGWQFQPDRRTVQDVLERALQPLAGRLVRVQGSGRTDSGVHARGQIVSFDVDLSFSDDVVLRALNARLPADVRVLEVARYEHGFHALRDVRGKRYRYLIQDGRLGDVFQRSFSWRVSVPLDDLAMAEAARLLVGEHDFRSFEAAGAKRKSTVRHVTEVNVQRLQDQPTGLIAVHVAANGFLYNMVRIIVGTLAEVGKGKQPPAWVGEALAARRREAAGPTAPPEGLCLWEVYCAK
ncbi:MAG: tRNA pseudouridine(38-40) synthase TruA [Planctomycetales bacterium]|nr:tRNA pseudouridine(38-40) synthase TruA [Planctomycetales bacterium]